MVSHIKLYGEKAERFEEIKEGLRNEFGYEPTNPEVVGVLMGKYRHLNDDRGGSPLTIGTR